MSKHKNKDKEKSRDERRSREKERSRERERRKRSRSRSKDRKVHKKSKDKDRYRRSRSKKSSRRDRSRDRSRSREHSRRSRSRSDRNGNRSRSPIVQATFPLPVKPLLNTIPTTIITAQQQPSTSSIPSAAAAAVSSITSISLSASQAAMRAREIAAARAKEVERAKNLQSMLMKGDDSCDGSNNSMDASDAKSILNFLNTFENGSEASQQQKRERKKKSRWASTNDGTEGKTFIPGMPTILPSNLNSDQQEAYLVQIQIEEISRKLKTGDLGVPANPEERSPSPEPVYSSDGKRLNTREFRTRKKLEEQRHMLITRMQSMNPEFKPPSDYKPPVLRVSDKVLIPQEEHPDINFVGLLIGPRGNTLKAMEKETGAKIIIRGKGSVKEGKVGRKDGQPLPGEDEPLHAFITASTPEAVNKAVEKIKEVIRQGIEVPEGCNDLRRMQLRELAQLNGTLRETDGMRCSNCGSSEHKSWLCPDKPNVTNNIVCSACGGAGHIAKDCKSKRPGLGGVEGSNNQAKIDEEYMSLMAELGEVPPETLQRNEPQQPPSKPYNIFDNPRHQQQPRAIGPSQNNNQPPMHRHPNPSPAMPPMAQPPWHQSNQHPIPPGPPSIPSHPMGSYPPIHHAPMPNNHAWPMIPPLPGQMNLPPPSIPPIPGINQPSIPPIPGMAPPGTELSPPGTEIDFKNWNAPPLPPSNYWGNGNGENPPLPGQMSNPPLPSFLPPPPPPE